MILKRRQPRNLRQRLAAVAPGARELAGYRRSNLGADLAAGLSVAAIALPVGVAYADLAGVPTIVGIYSAIFPLFAYALFGSSRQVIVGPDTATCLIVAASLGPLAAGDPARYASLLSLLTLMTAVILIVGGMARLGFMADFLSQPILTGYLNGVAILILIGQLPKLLGLSIDEDGVFDELAAIAGGLPEVHLATFVLGASLILMLVLARRFAPRLPAPLLAVAGAFAAVAVFGIDAHGVALIGEISMRNAFSGLPQTGIKEFGGLLTDAAGIALVAFTSGVLTAKSFAERNGYRVDANQELYGFGAGSLASWLGGGFPVTGAGSRTTVGDAAGGKTRMVGVIAGAVMLLSLFFLVGALGLVPVAALAAVVFVAALGLLDIKALVALFRMSRREFYISIAASLGVVLFGVLNGVLIAVSLSIIWLLFVMSRPRTAVLGKLPGKEEFQSIADQPEAERIPGLLIFRFEGNVIFFNAEFFCDSLRHAISAAADPVEWVIVDASPVTVIDATALRKIIALRTELEDEGVRLVTARARPGLQSFFTDRYGADYTKRQAVNRFTTMRAAVRAFSERGERGDADEAGESSG